MLFLQINNKWFASNLLKNCNKCAWIINFIGHQLFNNYNNKDYRLKIEFNKMDKKCLLSLIILSTLFMGSLMQTSCPKNCISCVNSTSCKTCSSGYYVDSAFQCRPCNTGCQTCSSPVTGSTVPKCTACLAGYNLNSNSSECFICSSSCLACS